MSSSIMAANQDGSTAISGGGSSSSSDTTLIMAASALVALQDHHHPIITNPSYSFPEEVNSYPEITNFKLKEKEGVIISSSAQGKQKLVVMNKGGKWSLNKLITRIGGSEPVLVIEKKLTYTDVNKQQARLLIPKLQVVNDDFLTEREKAQIARKQDLPVWIFDPKDEKSTLKFGLCIMNNNTNYALKNKWNKVVEANKWKKDMVLQVWSFRVRLQLCFALVHVHDGAVPKA